MKCIIIKSNLIYKVDVRLKYNDITEKMEYSLSNFYQIKDTTIKNSRFKQYSFIDQNQHCYRYSHVLGRSERDAKKDLEEKIASIFTKAELEDIYLYAWSTLKPRVSGRN